MYWTDFAAKALYSAFINNGTQVTKLVDTGEFGPRGMALDPYNGFLYWCGSDFDAKIHRST